MATKGERLPLAAVAAGRDVKVVALTGGQQFRVRALNLGVCPGVRLQVVRGGEGVAGPLLISVGDGRLAIGQGMAEKVWVEYLDADGEQ